MPVKSDGYFYNCSKEYINQISSSLYDEVLPVIVNTPKLGTQAEVNAYLFERFTMSGWSYDAKPTGVREGPLGNNRDLCLTSTTLDTRWRSDFAKVYDGSLVQIEVQFGK